MKSDFTRVFISGTSGTGKSTIVNSLNNRGIAALDTDSLGAWRDKATGDKAQWYPNAALKWQEKVAWHNKHHWIIDPTRFRTLLAEKPIRVVAGLAANQHDFEDLFTTNILLQCDEDVFVQRIRQRQDTSYGKDAAELQAILGAYKHLEADMLRRGAVPINANKPLELVVDEVLSYL